VCLSDTHRSCLRVQQNLVKGTELRDKRGREFDEGVRFELFLRVPARKEHLSNNSQTLDKGKDSTLHS